MREIKRAHFICFTCHYSIIMSAVNRKGAAAASSPPALLPRAALFIVQLSRATDQNAFEAECKRYSAHLKSCLFGDKGPLRGASLPSLRIRSPRVAHDALESIAHIPSLVVSKAGRINNAPSILSYIEHVVLGSDITTLVIGGTVLLDVCSVAIELKGIFGAQSKSRMTKKTLPAMKFVVDRSLCARDSKGDAIIGQIPLIKKTPQDVESIMLEAGIEIVNEFNWHERMLWEPFVHIAQKKRQGRHQNHAEEEPK